MFIRRISFRIKHYIWNALSYVPSTVIIAIIFLRTVHKTSSSPWSNLHHQGKTFYNTDLKKHFTILIIKHNFYTSTGDQNQSSTPLEDKPTNQYLSANHKQRSYTLIWWLCSPNSSDQINNRFLKCCVFMNGIVIYLFETFTTKLVITNFI